MGQKSVALVIAFIAILGVIIVAFVDVWSNSFLCGGAAVEPDSILWNNYH